MEKDYEGYLKELETIMVDFESGKLSLNDSLKNYEKALELIKKMEIILNEAQGKLIDIQENNNVSKND